MQNIRVRMSMEDPLVVGIKVMYNSRGDRSVLWFGCMLEKRGNCKYAQFACMMRNVS